MTKLPEPFLRTVRQAWFAQLGGRQINLGSDHDAAFRRDHEIMGQPQTVIPPVPAACSSLGVMDAFLDWSQKHKVPRTYDWYRRYLESFGRSLLGDPGVDEL